MPSHPTIEPEAAKMLSDADEVAALLDSKGWGVIKSKLDARVLDLQSIRNLDLTKPETLNIQLAARSMAVDEILAWLTKDVYGFVEQQQANNRQNAGTAEDFIGRA